MRQNISEPGLAAPAVALTPGQGIDPANPHELSRTLYNQDLAPTARNGRSWNAYSIFTLWANDVHSLGNYAFAIGLFALGMSAGQILGALAIGAALLFVLLSLSGYMGEKTGVPFPVMSRIAFGINGAQIPALIRGAVAIAWFGIQTYLASQVLSVMVVAVAPGAATLEESSILGLNMLGWICFVALWAVQLVIVSYGMEMIRKYEAFAGPVILVTFLALAIWMLFESGFNISLSTGETKTGGQMWAAMFGAAALWVSIYGTFVLNFCDFTRGASSKKAIIKGNFFGIPLNMLFFGAIVVVLTGTQFSINGKVITSPSDVVGAIPNTFLLLLASAALLVLTIAVNLMANFVAPTYALTNLFPKKLNFRSRHDLRSYRPGDPAVEYVQLSGNHQLLPWWTRCIAWPTIWHHHGRLLADPPCAHQRHGSVSDKSGRNLLLHPRGELPRGDRPSDQLGHRSGFGLRSCTSRRWILRVVPRFWRRCPGVPCPTQEPQRSCRH